MNQTVITEKITRDAEARAKGLVADAEKEAAARIGGAREQAEKRRAAAVAQAKKDAGILIANRLALAALDVRREELRARQAGIGRVYAAVKHTLSSLTGGEYRDLIRKMLVQYAEDGDAVLAGQSDIKKLDAGFIESVAKARKIRLTLCPEPGDFDGGIKLIGAVCDKNLTFDGLLAELRTETETEVVRLTETDGAKK
jgi:vacuolar-type H+-ATPase subunit E/Vma4